MSGEGGLSDLLLREPASLCHHDRRAPQGPEDLSPEGSEVISTCGIRPYRTGRSGTDRVRGEVKQIGLFGNYYMLDWQIVLKIITISVCINLCGPKFTQPPPEKLCYLEKRIFKMNALSLPPQPACGRRRRRAVARTEGTAGRTRRVACVPAGMLASVAV